MIKSRCSLLFLLGFTTPMDESKEEKSKPLESLLGVLDQLNGHFKILSGPLSRETILVSWRRR